MLKKNVLYQGGAHIPPKVESGDYNMLVTKTLSKDEKVTEKDIHMIEEAKKHPIVFDKDSPELTPEMEKAFLLAAKNRNRLKA